jgi:predicted amidophosphoribosyltransferase
MQRYAVPPPLAPWAEVNPGFVDVRRLARALAQRFAC